MTKGPIPAHERFGLCREEAASYVGVSATLFDEIVKDGRMPKPKRVQLTSHLEPRFVGSGVYCAA